MIDKALNPVAMQLDMEMSARLRTPDEEFDRLRGEIAEAFAGRPEEEIGSLVAEAVQAARLTAISLP